MGMVSPPGVQDVGGRESVQGPAGLLQGRPNHRGGWDSMVFFHATIPMAVLREENLMRYLGATSTMEAWL